MNKILLLMLVVLISQASFAKKLQVFFQQSSFSVPGADPYIETYMTAIGKSAIFKKTDNGSFQASISITLIFKQEGKVKNFKKYNLLSPEIKDTTGEFPNFVDQQRISIPDGIYNFELSVADNNNPSNEEFNFRDIIKIEFPATQVNISGIQFIEKFEKSQNTSIITKNGMDLYPYVSDFYPSNIDKLCFYSEIYNTDKMLAAGEDFLVKYSLMDEGKTKVIKDYARFKKNKPTPVVIVLSEFDISTLYTGNYNLVIDVVTKDNKTIASKSMFFQRSKANPNKNENFVVTEDISNTFVATMTDKIVLKENIEMLWPIANGKERDHLENVLKSDSLKNLQKFFYSFWYNKNSTNPQQEWALYKEKLDYVNKTYKTPIEKGFQSDRGRVYLQYGKPNDITENKHDKSAFPYEIWHYYRINAQNNIKFVFYNPDLNSNAYRLLHSDLKGEIQSYNWETIVGRGYDSTEDIKGNEHFSGKSKRGSSTEGKMQ